MKVKLLLTCSCVFFLCTLPIFAQAHQCDPDRELGNDVDAYIRRIEACLDAHTTSAVQLHVYELLAQILADANRAVELEPNNPAALAARGQALFLNGSYGRALVDYTVALQFEPDNAELYAKRAFVMNGVGDFDGSIADLTQAIALEPENAEWYFLRSHFYEAADQYDLALADVESITAFAPENAAAYERIGDIYYGLEQDELALQNYRRYAELTEMMSPLVNARMRLLEARLGEG